MTANNGISWKDLETKGFLHIPGFMSPEQVAACLADYAAQPVAKNENYAISEASDAVIQPIRQDIDDVMRLVSSQTNLKVDRVLSGTYFASKRLGFGWHQDHESYFILQNHYDYLNFYIPVKKPRKDKTNLSVVPFDALEKASPKVFRLVVRGGASHVLKLDGRSFLLQTEAGTTMPAPDVDAIACTPELEAGDLLLVRGDVLHRSQDTDTDRVAISIRVTSNQSIVRRSQMASGGLPKARMMAKSPVFYRAVFSSFDDAGRDEIRVDELVAGLFRHRGDAEDRSERFRNQLLREKLRSGVLVSSLRQVVNETVGRMAILMYHRCSPGVAARTVKGALRG